VAFAFNKFDPFIQAALEGKHNLAADELKVALVAAANAPTGAEAVLGSLVEVDYTFASPRVLTRLSAGQVAGLYTLNLDKLRILVTGGTLGPFRYVVMYNNTSATKLLISYYDLGSDQLIVNAQSFTVKFPSNIALQLQFSP
jgi:hypothetical protein